MNSWFEYASMTAELGRSVTEVHKVTFALAAMLLALCWPTSSNRQLTHAIAVGVSLISVALSLTIGLVPFWVAALFTVLVLVVPMFRDFHVKAAPWMLVALAVVSTANYARFGTRQATDIVNAYDVMHYYVNAKYFDEIGYLDLYPAILLVDAENDGPYFKNQGNHYLAQDGAVHKRQRVSHGIARGQVVRSNSFTPERWKAFEHDVLFLQREVKGKMPGSQWREMIQDHGFNGTTVWTLLARPLANTFPVESIKLLGYADVLLLFAGFMAIGWAYGRDTAMWGLTMLMVSYSTRWPTISSAFLRYDWIAGLLIAMALLRKNRPYLAGLFAGYAAALRFFPAFWMWGPFAKGVAGLFRRKVHRSLIALAVGFVVSVGVLQGAATARFGTETVTTHMHNMLDHNSPSQLSSRRIGMASALAYNGPFEATPAKYIEKWRKAKIGEQKNLRYGLAFLIMGVMGWALRNNRDDEAFGWGFIPIYLLTTMSYYYYIARVTLGILHGADLSRLRNQIGLSALFGIELFMNFSETSYAGHRVFLIGNTAWMLGLYTLVMMGWLLKEAREADEMGAPTAPST